MPHRHIDNRMRTYPAYHGLLGVGEHAQTAPRRDVASALPAINEGSTGTRSSGSSVEFAAGKMDFDDDERARLRSHRRQQKKLEVMVQDSRSSGASDFLHSNFTQCRRCNLWINARDQALHHKGCPTLGTSPVNVSRDADYRHPISSNPSSPIPSDPYASRGRAGYPGPSPSPPQRLSQSVPRTPSIAIPGMLGGSSHEYHPFHDASPIVSHPAPPYTGTLPPPYTSYIQNAYNPYPGIPPPGNPPATAIPIYGPGTSHDHHRHRSSRSNHQSSTAHSFTHLENDPYRSRSYGHHF